VTDEWGDPAPVTRTARWATVASELRARPGEWKVIATTASSNLAHHIRVGNNKSFPKGEFEATSRGWDKTTKRYAKVYARFIGENK
jgi:hypothetical protein